MIALRVIDTAKARLMWQECWYGAYKIASLFYAQEFVEHVCALLNYEGSAVLIHLPTVFHVSNFHSWIEMLSDL